MVRAEGAPPMKLDYAGEKSDALYKTRFPRRKMRGYQKNKRPGKGRFYAVLFAASTIQTKKYKSG